MKKNLPVLISFFVLLISCQGKSVQKEKSVQEKETLLMDSTDQVIFKSIQEIAKTHSLDSLRIGNRGIEIAKMFLQTPYVAGTLDVHEKEQLVVNFRELDCTTYLENVVALSLITGKSHFNDTDFLKELEFLRYKDGKLDGYASRLHYFSDWIYENEKKGIVVNMTEQIGGEKYNKPIFFMSTHVESYPALKADSTIVNDIRKTEALMNQRDMFFIPEEKIQEVEEEIQNGDLIAITTNIKGLDVSHVGIAIHMNGRLHLMHASSSAKKVVISDLPLAEMLLESKLQSGIMVARLKQ